MNILIISGMSPSKIYPFAGIFIAKRYENLRQICKCDLYKIGNKYTKFYKFLYERIFKKGKLENDSVIYVNGITWNIVHMKITLFSKILEKIDSSFYYKIFLNKKTKNLDIKKYNIIHAHWVYPTGYIAMRMSKKYKIPYIVTAHGSDIHTLPKKNKNILRYTLEVLENADKVIFVSENLKKEAINIGYSGKNANVIYNGVDIDKFYPLKKDLSKKDKKIVGYIGRLDMVKGADRIPSIFYNISKLNTNVEFVIIGDGKLKNEIIRKLNELHINYQYYSSLNQDDLNEYMNKMDVIIVPSRNESFSCIALEAQACGIKVVASKVGGIPECVGEYGTLVDEGPNYEKRFASKVIETFDKQIDIINMVKRTNKFQWERTVSEEYKLYKDVMGKGEI